MGAGRSWQAKLARITGRKCKWDRKACLIRKRLEEVRDALNQKRC